MYMHVKTCLPFTRYSQQRTQEFWTECLKFYNETMCDEDPIHVVAILNRVVPQES